MYTVKANSWYDIILSRIGSEYTGALIYIHHQNMIFDMDWCISHIHSQPSYASLCRFSLVCILCKHYSSCCWRKILNCAPVQELLHSVTITPVAPPQALEKLRISLSLFYIIVVFWPFDNIPNVISWISWKVSVKQEMWLTSVIYTTWPYVFGKEDKETFITNCIYTKVIVIHFIMTVTMC